MSTKRQNIEEANYNLTETYSVTTTQFQLEQ